MTNPTAPSRRRWPWLVLVLLLVGLGVAGWRWLWPSKPTSDPAAALEANIRGVGKMEQFDFAAAVAEFEQAVRLDPDWLPARVNLGLAQLNTATPEGLARAEATFQDVLARQPDNRHALYSLGMIALYQNRLSEAYPRFEAVSRLDPRDAHTWYHKGLTHPEGRDSAAARACFETALRLNPYFNAARYALAQHPVGYDAARSRQLLAEHKALVEANWESEYRIAYGEMGRYAEVIGRKPLDGPPPVGPLPLFEAADLRVSLAEGTSWTSDLDNLRRAIRDRFGGVVVVLDYNADGRADVFLLSAVTRAGGVGDLLLRNDGEGKFSDVTAEAGLAEARASLGCSVGDFDNDGRPDLVITGAGVQRLFRNAGGRFEDVTARAGLDVLKSICLGSCWVDLDQDGDLDLLLARYADDSMSVLRVLKGEKDGSGGVIVMLNHGVAPPAPPGAAAPPLSVAFGRAEARMEALLGQGPVTGLAVSDLDGDRDLDTLTLIDDAAPIVTLNDRLLRFRRSETSLTQAGRWNGALVLDVNHDERSDVLLIAPDRPASLLLSRDGEGVAFAPAVATGATLRQAQAIDLDLDGWTDVVGLSAGRPVLLHNNGQGLLIVKDGVFGEHNGLHAVAMMDLDLLAWSEQNGLRLLRNLGNGHHALRLELSGRRDRGSNLRTNADGVGAWAVAQAGPLWTGVENTTLSAGLGQSRRPLTLGLGKSSRADVVRVRWPDGVPQAELGVAAGSFRLTELNRKGTSCPILMAWDGQRFAFVTDFLGAGALGELQPDGSVRAPRPEESVKIEPGQLVAREGEYLLKIAEPMDEVLYLDRLQLLVVDHPGDVSVYPDERFVTSGPPPSQELLTLSDPVFPVKAQDHRGHDVTDALRRRDRVFADSFHRRSWLGYAEDHNVELDFGDRLARLGRSDRVFLVLAGWTDYPYPESIFAATQAGVALRPPVLEQLDGQEWRALTELGFPAGLPRVMTREVTGQLTGPRCTLRIATNMQVYWDQVYAAVVRGQTETVARLEVAGATLAARGFMQEVSPDGRAPIAYDDGRTEPVAVTRWRGHLTKLGEVGELLRQTDERFVLCGPGDEITVRFDARELPKLRQGWVRSFVLRTAGYCKDTAPFTLGGGEVEPLPGSKPPKDYRRLWNTRPAGGRR